MTTSSTAGPPLVRLENVEKTYPVRVGDWPGKRTELRAVDGVSLEIRPHETLGLVGESGCGKTTVARLILLLETPTSGRVEFRGRPLIHPRGRELREYRRSVQAVFQDPWSSLDPRMRARTIVGEPLVVNTKLRGADLRARVEELLNAVGLDAGSTERFPHEFSGGMRQRIAIARALGLQPSLIVLDEPVSALDVSIRAQIMNLLHDLQDAHGTAYLLIAHDLASVRYLCHRVAVMHLGEIVEEASASDLFNEPLHPYTKALISAAVRTRPGEADERIVLEGELPSPTEPPTGCRFHTRCPAVFERCRSEAPRLRELAPGHRAACHLYEAE